MKIREGFILRKIGSEYMAVAVGKARKDFNGLVRMNETGKFLWDALKTEKTEEELIACLRAEYEVDEEKAGQDIRVFLEKLKGAEILAL